MKRAAEKHGEHGLNRSTSVTLINPLGSTAWASVCSSPNARAHARTPWRVISESLGASDQVGTYLCWSASVVRADSEMGIAGGFRRRRYPPSPDDSKPAIDSLKAMAARCPIDVCPNTIGGLVPNYSWGQLRAIGGLLKHTTPPDPARKTRVTRSLCRRQNCACAAGSECRSHALTRRPGKRRTIRRLETPCPLADRRPL